MKRLITTAKHILILGKHPQTFLGARWVRWLLAVCPRRFKWPFALRLVSLSPHYFYRHLRPEYAHMSTRDFLEAEFERMRSTRAELCERIVQPHLRPEFVVLDIGCGPGFLARAVSGQVSRVWAADISSGVLACASVLNHADNLAFLNAQERSYSEIEDSSVDLVYSFAVIQHVSDLVFAGILGVCLAKLKAGGKGLIHVVVDDDTWHTEREWRQDRSFRGRMKLRYGLNCFVRKRSDVLAMAADGGLVNTKIVPVSDVAPDLEDNDLAEQHLLHFEKSK